MVYPSIGTPLNWVEGCMLAEILNEKHMNFETGKILVREEDLNLVIAKLDNIKTLLEKKGFKQKEDVEVEPLFSIEQTSHYLGLSRTELYRLTRKGKLSFTKVGGRRKYSKSDLDKYLNGTFYPAQNSIIR